MSEESTLLLSDALKLSVAERADFAAALWDSLVAESGLEDHSDRALLAETKTRRSEIKAGTAKTLSHVELKREPGR